MALLPAPAQARLRLAATRAWLALDEPARALPLLNAVLNQPTRLLPRHLGTVARLLHLQTHAALGNGDYLAYALRAAEREFRREKKPVGVENLVLRRLRRWLRGAPFALPSQAWNDLLEEPYERLLAREVRLAEWLGTLTASRPKAG